MSMAASVTQVTTPLSAAYQAADAVAIFHTIIDAAPKPAATPDHTLRADASDLVPANGDIVLENVNFSYPMRPEVKVLDNLSLRFPVGKVTAIVGPSGSGKTTIVGILERWYEFNGHSETNLIVSFTIT